MSGGGKSPRTWGAISNNTAASAHGLDRPALGGSQRNERNFNMNHSDGWMNGWSGGGMGILTVIGIVVVVLLVVVVINQMKK